jgi:NIMA (never in mitosis gene a)-related kinase 1/4/5
VMEYADNGDLYQRINELKSKMRTMSERDIWFNFIQIVRGLKAMHEMNVMHRDLKCANVFMNCDGTIKLGDMNVSKVANNKGLNFT